VRVRIHGDLLENKILTEADPEYVATLDGIEDENLKKAWRYGDWDIAAGGIFTDVWKPSAHILKPFAVPAGWEISRSFDWGSSKPFSVGWWARCNGEQVPGQRHFANGSMIRVAEWYGWNGKPNEGCHMLASEIATGIKERETEMGFHVTGGVADSAIWDTGSGHSHDSIANVFEQRGIRWTPANKGPGSRVTGWQKMRELFLAACKTPQEEPGIFVFDTCRQFIRTVPTLLRDKKKPDDVLSTSEDHCLTGDTLIITEGGAVPIKELVGKTGMVITHLGNIKPFYNTRITRRDAACVRVLFSDMTSITCTYDHKIWTGSDWVEAKNLMGWAVDVSGYIYTYANIQRCKLLPMREVLSEQGQEAASGSMGGFERPYTKGIPCSPYRREQGEQFPRESSYDTWDEASILAYANSGAVIHSPALSSGIFVLMVLGLIVYNVSLVS